MHVTYMYLVSVRHDLLRTMTKHKRLTSHSASKSAVLKASEKKATATLTAADLDSDKENARQVIRRSSTS
jgi:hypothetical protein